MLFTKSILYTIFAKKYSLHLKYVQPDFKAIDKVITVWGQPRKVGSMAAVAAKTNDFFILGPIMSRGNGVAEAIASLYYLPKRYKLVLHDGKDTDAAFREDMFRLVKRMALTTRVRFSDIDMPEADAVIVGSATPTDLRDERVIVSGGTPEALASAILNASRRLATA